MKHVDRVVIGVMLAGVLWSGLVVAGQDGWKRAEAGYTFVFPRDHASHPEYRIEWWYYTGNVGTPDGRRFGYQLTFFRVGLDPKPINPSVWSVRDLFMTHFAVTDVTRGQFRFSERLNRAGVGWAGATSDAYRVWNEDWEARLDADGRHRLTATDREIGLDLRLDPGEPPVIHGEGGISQKGSESGNATHYYSVTRMPTRGSLRIEGQTISVEGLSWMDHEFGTSVLEPGQQGWDWFSIQLDEGSELMVFQLRRADGSVDPHSSGTLVDSTGRRIPIRAHEFTLAPSGFRKSAASGADYPLGWKIAIPGSGLTLSIRAAVADQELHAERSTGVTYWEGAIVVSGEHAGRSVRGRGYLEMTGYAGPPMGNVLQ